MDVSNTNFDRGIKAHPCVCVRTSAKWFGTIAAQKLWRPGCIIPTSVDLVLEETPNPFQLGSEKLAGRLVRVFSRPPLSVARKAAMALSKRR